MSSYRYLGHIKPKSIVFWLTWVFVLLVALTYGPRLISTWGVNLHLLELVETMAGCSSFVPVSACTDPLSPILADLEDLASTMPAFARLEPILVGAYAQSGQIDRTIEIWSGLEEQPDAVSAYWAGWAYERQGMHERTKAIWREYGLPSQAALRLRHQIKEEQDEQRLLALVSIATFLEPTIGSGYPYHEIIEAAEDYHAWGYDEQAADLMGLVAAHESLDNSRHWYAAAEAARLRGDIDEMDRILTEAEGRWPDTLAFYERHVRMLLLHNRWEQATQVAMLWAGKAPSDALALYLSGEALYRSGDHIEARQWLEQALEFGPSGAIYVLVERRLGNIAHSIGDYAGALMHYEAAIQVEPGNSLILSDMAQAYYAMGNTAAAVDSMLRAIDATEEGVCPAEWYVHLGGWYREGRQTEEAIGAYRSTLQCTPDNPQAMQALKELGEE